MADDQAQDKGQVAQPAADSSSPAPPTPQPEDVEALKARPYNWQAYQKNFGSLPDGFEKPRPTQEDIDALNARPQNWDQFEKAFGELPQGWSKDSPAKLTDFRGGMPEVTVTGKKPGPESSWGDVAGAIPTAIGAGEERSMAAVQEQGGAKSAASGAVTGILNKATGASAHDVSSPYDQAHIKLWQAQVLPDALAWAKQHNAALTDDPLVQQAAARVGVRPDQFTKDWQDYANKTPDELRAMRDEQRGKLQDASADMQAGAKRRELAGEVESQYAPNTEGNALKGAAFTVGVQGPELAGAVALSVLAPITALPATAMLTTDMAQRAYSSGKDAGLSDQDAKAYGLLTGLTMFVPGAKVADVLNKAPGAGKLLQTAFGKMLGASAATKIAGGTLDTTATFTVMNALQAGVDKGFIDPNMTLSDAISSIAGDIKGNALTAGAMSAFHVGAHRAKYGPEPKTPQQLEDSLREKPGVVPSGNDEAILQAISDQQPVKPADIQQLLGKGLITVGKSTGKPMILPAGKRFMEEAKSARETASDTAKGNAEIESQPKVTEEADTDAAGKAPRTAEGAEDQAEADARRAGNHNNALQPEQAEKQRQIELSFIDRDAEAEKQKSDDYLRAQNQRADEIIANSEHQVTENPGKMSIADALATAKKPPEAIDKMIPRNPDLSPEERNIESRFIDQIGSNVNKAIDDYKKLPSTDGGRMISTDEVRMLSPDHVKDPSMATAIHEPSSWLANVMFRRALAEPPKPGQDNHVIFTSGGSGSAKSSSLFGNEHETNSLTKRAQVIYDTAMESPANALSKVKAARDSGKFVSVAFVYRDPVDSWRGGVLPRAMENGRIVTADAHARTHVGAPEAIRQIIEKYKDDPKVSVIAIDNSNGDGKAQLMDPAEALKLPSKVSIGRLNREALEALRANEISPHVYERATGLTAPAESVDGEPAKDAESAVPGNGNAQPTESEHSSAEVRGAPERGSAVDQKLGRLEQRARRRMAAERERAAAMRVGGKSGYSQISESLRANDNAGFRELLGARNDNIRENTRAINSAYSILDTLLKHSKDERVTDLATALRIHAPDVPVNFVRDVIDRDGAPRDGAAGQYVNGTVQVKMSLSSAHGVKTMVGTVLHELVHVATYSAIEGDPNGPLATKMRALLAEARDLAAKKYGQDIVDQHIKFFESGATGTEPAHYNRSMYALTNVHELMAEGLSSDDSQKFLNALEGDKGRGAHLYEPTEPRGIFGKIVDGIAKFLGIKDSSKSLLADIIATTGKVMQGQTAMGFNGANLLRLEDGKPTQRDQRTRDIVKDVEDGRLSKLVQAAAELGALKIVRGIVRFEDWRGAMQEELGAGIKPIAQRLYDMAKDKTVDIKSLVYKTRGKTFVGGPPGIGKDDLAPLRSQLRKLAREGEFGKDWYDESSKAILDAVNGDRDEAKKLAGLMSIFSARTGLSGNTTMALRAWYQWKAGEPIKAGTTDKNELAQRWLETGVEPTGMKRSNFYGNLLQSLEGDAGSVYSNGVTVDMWMMRALGYRSQAPTLAQYAFVSDQVRQVAKSLKWSPTQVQAAVWVAMKTRWEQVRSDINKEAIKKGWLEQKKTKAGPVLEVVNPERYYGRMFDKAMEATLDPEHLKRSAANFSTELLKHRAQVSWEAMPGSSSRRMLGLDGVPIEALEAFQRDVSQAHIDPRTGNDQLMQALGILSMGHVDGNSAWFHEHGQVMRFRHWSVKDGLSQLDPRKMGTSGVGMTAEERSRTNKVTALYPYELGDGQPEKLVSSIAKHQYVVEIPAAKLYDSARDPRGLKQAAQEPIAMDADGNPTDFAYSHDTFEQLVKDAGFTGYYVNDPGTELHGQARVFEPVAATPASLFGNSEPSGVLPYSKAGAQEIIYAPLAKGAAQEPGAPLDPQAKALMQSYAAALGKLNHQDSVGWHRPRFGRIPGAFQNGIELKIPNATRDDYMRVYKQMADELKLEGLTDRQAAEFAPVQTDTGVRFLNWGALDNVKFQKAAERAFKEDSLFSKKYEYTPFAADGGLIDNDWRKHPNGEGYDSIIAGNGHTARLRDALADIRGRVEEIYSDYAKRLLLDDPAAKSSARANQPTKASDPVSLDQLKSGAGLHENVLRRFGSLGTADTLEQLKLYDLKRLTDNPQEAAQFAKKLGFDVEYFSFESDPSKGVEFRLPRLGKNGYENGKLWLYDPRVGAGSFYDTEYTRAWRITHELGHALTEQLLQSRYGDSRRYGRLGQELEVTRGVLGKQRQVTERPLSLAEAQRAVEWEDAAFRAQREILKQLGVSISDADFAREYNVNLSDAVYRVLSGNFGDPALSGFIPNDSTQPLKDVLGLLSEAEKGLAKDQGRPPTSGIDLENFLPISDAELRQVLENRASGVQDVKFAARPHESMDYRVVVKDGQGNEIDGPHQDLLFNNEDDASDHITRMADEHAGPSGDVDHNHYWSQVSKGGKVDRTFAIEPVSKNPFHGQSPRGGAGGPAARFVGEFEKHYPQGGDIGERLVNGNVAVAMVTDPIDQGTAYLSYVRSLEPGSGAGTKAMRDIVGMADKHGITLELNAVPFGPNGLPNNKLLEWYTKLGFKMHGEPGTTAWGTTSQFMRRVPAEKPGQIEPYATNAGKGLSHQDAAEVVRRAKEMFPQATHHLAASIEDTPHEVQAIAAMRGLTDRVQAAYVREYDGTHVWMVQNNMRSVDEALRTMVEENVGHDGIAKTFGPEVGNLMDGFLRNEALRPAIIEMAAREGINLRAANTPLARKEALRAAAEEWLAHGAAREISGQRAPAGLRKAVQDVTAAVKVWAASKGLGVTLGHAEALHALAKAHRYVTSGDWMTRISEQREQAAGEKVKFAAVPPSGNADLDELLNDKIGAEKVGWRTRLSGASRDIRTRAVISGLDRMYRVKQYEDDMKVPPAESGYISMRLATNVAPLLRNLIEFGHLKWTETPGADIDKSMTPDFKEGKPLNEILAPLGNDPQMLRRFEGYLVALRSKDLMSQGRENLLEQRHIQAGLALATQYPHFVTMQKELAAINRNMLDFAERAGVIDPESRKMWESDYYVPFYRVTDDAGAGPWSAGSMAKVRNPIMRLMGSKEKLNDVTGNIVRNWSTLINASIKAHAVRVAVDNLSQAGVAARVPALERGGDALVPTSEIDKLLQKHGFFGNYQLSANTTASIQKLMSLSTPQGDDIVQVWRGGKREYYRLADPALATAFAALKGSALKNLEDDPIGKVVVGAMRMPKMVFTKLTTENPLFGIRTLYKDNINAWTVGRGYMPVTPVVSAITGLVKTMRGTEAFKRMAAAGATFNAGRADPYDTNLTAKRYIRSPSIAGRTWDFYRDMMTSGENASRVTIYERTEKETGSHKIAAYEARDLMDYAMRGSSPIVQFLVETVPFWGAHVQGIYKTARSFVPENSRTWSQIAAGAGKRMAPILLKGMLLSTLSAGLYMHNRDNPNYQELTDLDKELYYHIFFGNYHVKIPKAFESGTIFGTVPELMADAFMHGDPQVAKEDAQSLLHAFGAGLNLYPRVTALTPLWELMTNHNTSTGAPILSDFDQKLVPSEQVGPTTSAAVTAAARSMPGMAPDALQSPKRLQHLIQGYLGIMGSYGLAAADYLYRKATNLPATADRNLGQIPLVGQVVTRTDQPPTNTRSLTELSNVMIEANKVQDTIKELEKKEDDESLDRADELRQKNEELLNAGDQIRPLYEDIKKLNAAKRQIQGDPTMTGAEKQKELNEIQRDIDDEARDAYEYRPGSKLSKELLESTTSVVTPAEKARILRKANQPSLASIVTQFAKGMPPSVQSAIEELS